MSDFFLRKARIPDVKTIHALLMQSAREQALLPRSYNQLYSHLRDFYVLTSGEGREVLGCCALNICWEDLGEIRSLVVVPEVQHQGFGRKLVETCLSEAVTLGVYKVFTLTYQREFFAKLGFAEVNKDQLPQKVWADCIHCPRFPECDEVAMIMEM